MRHPGQGGPAQLALGSAAAVAAAEEEQDEVEYIDYTLRRSNLAYQQRSGMLGRWATPEELAVGSTAQDAEERMTTRRGAAVSNVVSNVVFTCKNRHSGSYWADLGG